MFSSDVSYITEKKDIVLLINDVHPEFVAALHTLSGILKIPLIGVVLIDKKVFSENRHIKDSSNTFVQLVCDLSDITETQKILRDIKHRILLVTASSERNQPFLQKVLPFTPHINAPTERSLEWATNKYKMRQLLFAQNERLVPNFCYFETLPSKDQLIQLTKKITFPVIVKPTGLATSILVNKCGDIEELQAVLGKTFEKLDAIYERDRGRGKPSLVVEEFIEGIMYSVDCYVGQNGEFWCLPFLKITTAADAGYEGFYSYQASTDTSLSTTDITNAERATRQSVSALNLRSSVCHVELIHTKSGWKIVELGPRAGGYRQDLYYLSYNIDHTLNEYLIKIGQKPILRSSLIQHSSAINIYAEKEGTINNISGINEAMSVQSVKNLQINAALGDKAQFSINGGKILGFGILANTSKADLQQDISKVRELLNFDIS